MPRPASTAPERIRFYLATRSGGSATALEITHALKLKPSVVFRYLRLLRSARHIERAGKRGVLGHPASTYRLV